MNRILFGVLVLAVFLVGIVYLAMGQFDARCEACVNFRGRTICDSARASNPADAQEQATYSACSRLAQGVTEIVSCTNHPPRSLRCEQ